MNVYFDRFNTLVTNVLPRCTNAFQKDLIIKVFNDKFYYNGGDISIYDNDNFSYVRMRQTENTESDIIESILSFLRANPEFHARTGLGFIDLMYMDPSTSTYIQNSWMSGMIPEHEKDNKQDAQAKLLLNNLGIKLNN